VAGWLIKLRGHYIDLQDLATRLQSPGLSVTEVGGAFYLRSAEIDAFPSVSEAHAYAATLVPTINGAAKVALPAFEPVDVDVIHLRIEDGGTRRPISFSTLRGRGRPDPPTGSGQGLVTAPHAPREPTTLPQRAPAAPPRPTQLEAFLSSARRREVELALRFIGNTPDWFNLWKVWELIRDDIGGRRQVERLGWATSGAIEDFSESANTFQFSGEGARPAMLGRPPAAGRKRMSLSQAESFIHGLLTKWLATK
jgi:hypothetical protein